jgi:hypothetical protein
MFKACLLYPQKRTLLAQMEESSGSRLMRASVGCWLSAAANGAVAAHRLS